ncbi:hypothetical protein LTR78_006045 [Recurvomyces mirabilis]|uniref:DRBM domain-containing protein n=1 Tax=Recurvomyces mirabilis TaxID=574656 RepID=A0AAE1C0S0_9PEZI|nr:hypothetical protein LTR78_006045 [Recurvomyces mirabilis]KAK5155144.1 hypothetical protein LTS14_006099 [Recurvomyces mirabilis]
MERLLDSLLVPDIDGLLVPASSQRSDDSIGDFDKGTMSSDYYTGGETLVSRPKVELQTSTSIDEEPNIDANGYGDQLMSIEDVEDPNWAPARKLVPSRTIKPDPEHAVKFQHACDSRGMVPEFRYQEDGSQLYSVTVAFSESLVDGNGTFPNKWLAKEAVCKRALLIIQELGTIAPDKRKNIEFSTPNDVVSAAILNGTNWIGTLQDYCQLRRLKLPEYEELQTTKTPYTFACGVKLAMPNAPLLGSRTDTYSNKALARKAAAREAVIWLRSQGAVLKDAWVNDVAAKRVKLGEPDLCSTDSDNDDDTSEPAIEGNAQESLPSQVASLAISLGFSHPSYHIEPSRSRTGAFGSDGSPFVDVGATFLLSDVRKEPRLGGTLGQHTNVFGKKATKEKCCQEVLDLLKAIMEERTS